MPISRNRDETRASPTWARARACHLREIALGEIALTAFQLLKSGGRAALCYPAARVHTLLDALARNRLAPKRIRAVQNRATDAPRLFLLDAVKLGGVALQWEKPLILRDARGEYSDEYRRIYHISEQN